METRSFISNTSHGILSKWFKNDTTSNILVSQYAEARAKHILVWPPILRHLDPSLNVGYLNELIEASADLISNVQVVEDYSFLTHYHACSIIVNAKFVLYSTCLLLYHLCDLVVRFPGCRPRGPGFDCGRYQTFWIAVGLERRPFSFVRINEERLERKSSGSGL
jgi:hypothetical protein